MFASFSLVSFHRILARNTSCKLLTYSTATTNETDSFPQRFAFKFPAHLTLPMMGKGRLHGDKVELCLGTVRPRREGHPQPPRQRRRDERAQTRSRKASLQRRRPNKESVQRRNRLGPGPVKEANPVREPHIQLLHFSLARMPFFLFVSSLFTHRSLLFDR